MFRFLTFVFCFAPAAAWACGGLFCNNAQPVNQAAERILFAVDGEQIHMHVRITYSGPPSDFGWLLPVPDDVETDVSSEQLFTVLDQNFGPQFRLRREFDDGCGDFSAARAAPTAAFDDSAEGASGGVQVLSREQVGPYDRAILKPDSVKALRDWLDENEYQIPEGVDETLEPYVKRKSAFVAIKLVPGQGSSDIVPLKLSFAGNQPTIPIVPTSVAADPDMGIIVHLLGSSRAIPINYRHVTINETAIDWLSGGQNYPDVVSQAADEANGQAFTTDFAGPHEGNVTLSTVMQSDIAAVAEIRELSRDTVSVLQQIINRSGGDTDIVREITGTISVPEDSNISVDELVQCLECRDDFMGIQVDGAALAMRLESVNKIREDLTGLFGKYPYITRLYSTMSPSEMTVDPSFGFNRDLDPIDNVRQAVMRIRCRNGEPDPDGAVIETPSGLTIQLQEGAVPSVVMRQNGATMRGSDVMAAAVIVQHLEAGQPDVIEDRTPMLQAQSPQANAVNSGDSGGCACDSTGGGVGDLFFFVLLLPWIVRRRSW